MGHQALTQTLCDPHPSQKHTAQGSILPSCQADLPAVAASKPGTCRCLVCSFCLCVCLRVCVVENKLGVGGVESMLVAACVSVGLQSATPPHSLPFTPTSMILVTAASTTQLINATCTGCVSAV